VADVHNGFINTAPIWLWAY